MLSQEMYAQYFKIFTCIIVLQQWRCTPEPRRELPHKVKNKQKQTNKQKNKQTKTKENKTKQKNSMCKYQT